MSEHLYAGIRRFIASRTWCMSPEYIEVMMDVMIFRMNGGRWSEQEIAARIAAASHGGGGPSRPVSPSSGAIAVIPLIGMISQRASQISSSGPQGTSVEDFGQQYAAAMNDPAISAIVLDVDSPGGTWNGVPEQADRMYNMRGQKRTVAVANGLMCSAAYWLSAAADEIVATPSADVGSIGVYTVRTDMSEAIGREGVKKTVVKAGKYKAEGDPSQPMGDDELANLTDRVNEAYDMFTGSLATMRGVKKSEVVNGYGEGRALSASKAKAAGMVDRVATLDDVIGRLSSSRGGPKPGAPKSGKNAAALRQELELTQARTI